MDVAIPILNFKVELLWIRLSFIQTISQIPFEFKVINS